ncbi:MAG: hypothetical protein HYT94_03110 [Parcubacteria group bacterium]|nr:hypothetical protein [Parcubacteria group bacterium]
MKKNEHIYLQSIGEHEGLSVWLVDGEKIRKDIDENFVQYDHHARFRFIPADEIWIDQETNKDERKYFLENISWERKFMKEGMTLEEAVEKADKLEARERRESLRVKNILTAHHMRKKALEKIRKEKLCEYSSDTVQVYLVYGEFVRDFYLVEYAEGGHDLVYSFIPRGEIWIEEVLHPSEQKFIILHELHERFLMSQGKDYPHAHKGATIIEDHFRENPEGLEERIREELLKNNL